MLAAAWLTVVSCTIKSATVSHNYSDIGTIKIDAYINTQRSHANANTSDRFDMVRATSNEADGKCFSFVTSDLLPRHGLHDSFCSSVAQIRSFHMNNNLVGYIWMNTPRLVHRLIVHHNIFRE